MRRLRSSFHDAERPVEPLPLLRGRRGPRGRRGGRARARGVGRRRRLVGVADADAAVLGLAARRWYNKAVPLPGRLRPLLHARAGRGQREDVRREAEGRAGEDADRPRGVGRLRPSRRRPRRRSPTPRPASCRWPTRARRRPTSAPVLRGGENRNPFVCVRFSRPAGIGGPREQL